MSSRSGAAAGLLLAVAGLWLLLQTLTADLPARILGLSGPTVAASNTTSPDSPSGQAPTPVPAGPGSVTTPGAQPGAGYAPYTPPAQNPYPPGQPPAQGSPTITGGTPTSPPAPTFP